MRGDREAGVPAVITHTDDRPERPRPTVRLVGQDGNAFMVMGLAFRALREAGWSKEERLAFQAEATSGDYHHLLRTVMKYLDVE
jgi:hypothetical protein